MMTRFDLPTTITPSRVVTAARCHRRHVLQDLIQWGKYYSPALEFGTVVHSGCGEWWRTGDLNKALIAVRKAWGECFENPNKVISTASVSLKLAEAMLKGYSQNAYLAGTNSDESEWQVVSIEDRLPVNLGDHLLTMQQDRVLYHPVREVIRIVDTKTASRLDKKWRNGWEMDLQMKMYKWAMQKLYELPVEVVIEGVLKETTGEVEYVFLPDWTNEQLEEASWMAERIANEDAGMILEAQQRGVDITEFLLMFSRHNPHDCFSYGQECQFRELCLASPSERIGVLQASYQPIEGEEY